jgi:transforming growth factor-beta-induced protein
VGEIALSHNGDTIYVADALGGVTAFIVADAPPVDGETAPDATETWPLGETVPPDTTDTVPPGETVPPDTTEIMSPLDILTETMPPMPEPGIDLATAFGNFWNLTAAATLARLQYRICIGCSYTVFEPTGEAFSKLDAKLLAKLLTPPWLAHLTQVMANHFTDPDFGGVLAEELVDGPIPMLSLENVTVTVDGGTVTIESAGSPNDASVVETDLLPDNRVVHTVDIVLLPSFVSTDIIGLAHSSLSGDFTLFFEYFEAIGGAALLEAVDDEGVTVFAPTNEAFAALGEETLANLSQAEWTQILSNHVLWRVVPSFAISESQVKRSLGGLDMTFTFVDETIMVNDAIIVTPNVLANNGIVHVIDKVLGITPTGATEDLDIAMVFDKEEA